MLGIGFFSELLKDSMARQQLSAKALAEQVGGSYEHVRKMVRSEALPSPELLGKVCAQGCLPKGRAKRYAEIDRARKKFGPTFWTYHGINPKYEEVYILWHFLTAEQQEMSYEFLKFLVARRTTRGEETQINPHRSEVA